MQNSNYCNYCIHWFPTLYLNIPNVLPIFHFFSTCPMYPRRQIPRSSRRSGSKCSSTLMDGCHCTFATLGAHAIMIGTHTERPLGPADAWYISRFVFFCCVAVESQDWQWGTWFWYCGRRYPLFPVGTLDMRLSGSRAYMFDWNWNILDNGGIMGIKFYVNGSNGYLLVMRFSLTEMPSFPYFLLAEQSGRGKTCRWMSTSMVLRSVCKPSSWDMMGLVIPSSLANKWYRNFTLGPPGCFSIIPSVIGLRENIQENIGTP